MTNPSFSGHKTHLEAEVVREKDEPLKALQLYEEAIHLYQKEKNPAGIAEALLGRFLTYKHLFTDTEDEIYLILAKQQVISSLEIAKRYNLEEMFSLIYFNLGEAYVCEKKYAEAVENYEKSLKNYNGSNALKGHHLYHLGEALFRKGDKELGEQKMREGLSLIQKNAMEVDPYTAHVWESGNLMKLAEALYQDKPAESKIYLEKAGEIIENDEKLVIRKKQYEKLKNDLRNKQMKRYNEESIL